MKKLIVCLALAAFALVPAAQAGEKNVKASATKAETAAKTEAACTATTAKVSTSACAAKTACCDSAKSIAKRGLKGAQLLAMR